jgi:hypothetical protein
MIRIKNDTASFRLPVELEGAANREQLVEQARALVATFERPVGEDTFEWIEEISTDWGSLLLGQDSESVWFLRVDAHGLDPRDCLIGVDAEEEFLTSSDAGAVWIPVSEIPWHEEEEEE